MVWSEMSYNKPSYSYSDQYEPDYKDGFVKYWGDGDEFIAQLNDEYMVTKNFE